MRSIAVAAAAVLLAAPARAQGGDTLRLSLEDAVARAQETSEEARLAEARVDVTGAQLVSARSTVLPQLRLSGSYNHVMESARAQAVNTIFSQPNTYNVNANLSQTIFQGGRAVAGLRAARDTRAAAELTEAETRAQLALDVQRAYLGAVLAGQLVEIQQANLDLAQSQLEQVQRFEEAGRAARYDVLRARVQRANLQPLLIQAQNDRELAELELKRLVNLPIERPLHLTTTVDTATLSEIVDGVERAAADAERASLRAAELTEHARREGIRVARADLLPTVSVFVQSGFQAYPTENRLPSWRGRVLTVDCPPGSQEGRVCTTQNGGFFGDRSLGVQLSWSLFDGLRAKGDLDLARAQARVAELELARTRESVAIEVAAARATLTRSRALFEANRQNVAEAQEAYRLAALRFSRGLSTQLEVQDAQLALLTAEINQARSASDLYLAAAELARASGATIPTLAAARP